MEAKAEAKAEANAKLSEYPGMARYRDDGSRAASGIIPFRRMHLDSQKNVMLATAVINEDNIFMNGLFQNIYIMYRMFEAMGWRPMLMVNMKPENLDKIPKYMKDVRLVGIGDVPKLQIPLHLYIEIGMSTDASMRRYLRSCGAKICKLYLGNILNIDIETPIFYQSMYFAHHVIGELDAIWVSPHYTQHAEYARAINHVDVRKPESPVVPYVWDPQILTRNNERTFSWTPPADPDTTTFLIVEPNISFQKCSLVPLMILEKWFRGPGRDWKGEVVVVNGDRLMLIPFFKETIWPRLEIAKAGRVTIKGRMDILTIMNTWPSAIPICTQWNNEYNYMVLEYFHAGYPVLHNASDWGNYGYYYKDADLAGAAELVEKVRQTHKDNLEVFRAHTRALLWRHSPYNPEVHAKWNSIIEGLY
jgi:hypothetical protein